MKTIVVSAVRARADIGNLLRRVEDERRSLVIEKRGTRKAVLLSIRDYVRLAAPEPEVLRIIGEESQRKGTDKLTSRQIDRLSKPPALENRSADDTCPDRHRHEHCRLCRSQTGWTPAHGSRACDHQTGQTVPLRMLRFLTPHSDWTLNKLFYLTIHFGLP